MLTEEEAERIIREKVHEALEKETAVQEEEVEKRVMQDMIEAENECAIQWHESRDCFDCYRG